MTGIYSLLAPSSEPENERNMIFCLPCHQRLELEKGVTKIGNTGNTIPIYRSLPFKHSDEEIEVVCIIVGPTSTVVGENGQKMKLTRGQPWGW